VTLASTPTSTPFRTGSRRSAARCASSSTPRTRRSSRRSNGNVVALLAARDHITVFLYDGGLAPDPEGIITGGHGNETGRMIAIHEGEPINRRAFTAIVRSIIADNRAGGWRTLKKNATRS
jgi:hypothetical protein